MFAVLCHSFAPAIDVVMRSVRVRLVVHFESHTIHNKSSIGEEDSGTENSEPCIWFLPCSELKFHAACRPYLLDVGFVSRLKSGLLLARCSNDMSQVTVWSVVRTKQNTERQVKFKKLLIKSRYEYV